MTSGVCEGMLAPSSFCWPNLGCESPPSGNPEGLAWQGRRFHLPASAAYICGQAIAVNREERDIHGSPDIHGLQLVIHHYASIQLYKYGVRIILVAVARS